jgi:hypothetical protein
MFTNKISTISTAIILLIVSIYVLLGSIRQIRQKVNEDTVPARKYLGVPAGVVGIITAILLIIGELF